VERSVEGVTKGIRCFAALSPEERSQLGAQAQSAVAMYKLENFVKRWWEFYAALA
jgi:glycosyltransferase involved in cell wall biosynthesis